MSLIIAMSLGACNPNDSLQKQDSFITATLSDVTSRVDYQHLIATSDSASIGKIDLTWSAGDKINLYVGSVSPTTKITPSFTLSATSSDAKTASFMGGLFPESVSEGITPLYAFVEKPGLTIDEKNSTISVDFTNQAGTMASAMSRDALFAASQYNSLGNKFTFASKVAMLHMNLNLSESGNCRIELIDMSDKGICSSVVLNAVTGDSVKSVTDVAVTIGKDVKVNSGSNDLYFCFYPQTLEDLYAQVIYDNGHIYSFPVRLEEKNLVAGHLYQTKKLFHAPIKYLSSSKPKPVTLIVTCADFEDADLLPAGAFVTKAKACIDYMFSAEPYKTYKEYFNVYIMPAHSADLGYTNLTKEGDSDYKYDLDINSMVTYLYYNCPDFYNLSDFEYSGIHIAVLANTKLYYGITYVYDIGASVAVISTPDDMLGWSGNNGGKLTMVGDYRNIFLHEFGGHGFGRLEDEYWYDDNSVYSGTILENKHNWLVPFGKNVMSATEVNGPSGYNWEHMMTGPIKIYPKEGRNYEGGFYHGKGAFRPEQISVMDDNRLYFNAYSRQLIVERILSWAGEPFDYATFVQKDVDKDPTPNYSMSKGSKVRLMKPLPSPRLIETQIKIDRQGRFVFQPKIR